MVISAKIYSLPKEAEIENVRKKISNYNVEKVEEHEGKKFNLITKISNVKQTNNSLLEGVFSKDEVIYLPQRGSVNPTLYTRDSFFTFIFNERKSLIIFEKKQIADAIANELSKILFIKVGMIIEVKIEPSIMRRFHEENRQNTKVIFFNDVKIPGIKKLSLYGENLANLEIYNEYLKLGNIWYIVFQSKITNGIAGLTRDGVVVHFSKIELKDFQNFIINEILKILI
jgi:hypothetical protein